MSPTNPVEEMAAGVRPLPPFDRHLGWKLVAWHADGATMKMDADARWHNPHGVLHGGALAALTDSAMGLTVTGLLEGGARAASSDLHIRFLEPVKDDILTAQAKIVRRGQRSVVMECHVTGEDGTLIAVASATFAIRA